MVPATRSIDVCACTQFAGGITRAVTGDGVEMVAVSELRVADEAEEEPLEREVRGPLKKHIQASPVIPDAAPAAIRDPGHGRGIRS